MTHLAIFVAPLAFSSQQPHPRTSSAAGEAHQAGSQPHIPHTRSHKSTHRAACTRSPDWKSMGRDDADLSSHHRVFSAFSLIFSIFCTQDKHKMQKIMPRIPDTSNPRLLPSWSSTWRRSQPAGPAHSAHRIPSPGQSSKQLKAVGRKPLFSLEYVFLWIFFSKLLMIIRKTTLCFIV